MDIIALVNQKGGVGKSTSAINMSSILAEMGKKVLLLDVDPQGNSSYSFGLDTDNLSNTIYEVFTHGLDIREAIHKTEFGVDVIPANILFANAELEISSKMNRESILKNALKKTELDYDFMILDLPPNLGLLTLNGLACADYILIPVDTGVFSLSGINQLVTVMQLIQENELNPNIDILGVLLTKVDARTNLSKEIYSTLKDIFGDKVFDTRIHQNIKIGESQKEQKPINHYLPKDRGTEEYTALVKEVLSRVDR